MAMSLSLWMLLGFAGWTLFVLVAGVGVPRWLLIFKGEAAIASFPGDTPHGSAAYRRAMRAHANCVENLPVFGAIVLVGAVAQLGTPDMDRLAIMTMAARIIQTSIHLLLPQTNRTVALRFTFYSVQVLAMAGMGIELVMAARSP
jgi:uncharacterized MAPEG superfamily protein